MLLAGTASALNTDHLTIEIALDNQGSATITENYLLSFVSPFEERSFRDLALENSSNLLAWQSQLEFFFPHFESIAGNSRSTTSITYDEKSKTIILRYILKEKFARIISKEQRSDSFVIDQKQWSAFKESGSIVIPENTTVRLLFPANTEIDSDKLPSNAIVEGNIIELSGIQSNFINVEYKIAKPILPGSDDLFENITGIYTIAIPILIVILLIGYVKREDIESKVENYLVAHSEVNFREPEEELDFDLDK